MCHNWTNMPSRCFDIMPYLDDRLVEWTHSFMIVFLRTVINASLSTFIWTLMNTVLVYFQFGKRITHWICWFFSICSFSSNPWCFILEEEEAYTPLYFVCMLDCVLNSSFSTTTPWDFHLSFCCEMISRNLERHNWRRIRKKLSKAFVNFCLIFWY